MKRRRYVVLVRHGQSESNELLACTEDGFFYSNSGSDPSIPLTPTGVQQGAEVGARLARMFPAERPLKRLFHTAFDRVLQTADQIELQLPYAVPRTLDRRLDKRNYGTFWNMTRLGVEHLHPEEWQRYSVEGDLLYRPPNGENYPDQFARVDEFIEETLSSGDDDVLIVAHLMTLLAFKRNLEGISDEEVLRLYEAMSLPNAHILIYCQGEDGRWVACDDESIGTMSPHLHHATERSRGTVSKPMSEAASNRRASQPRSVSMKTPLAKRVQESRPSVMTDLVRKSADMRESGREVIDLGAGVPDYAAPGFLLDAAADSLRTGNNSYGDSRGVPNLRAAVSAHFQRAQGISYDANAEVTITAGASAALNSVLLSLVNPGDGVALFTPYFEFFLPQIRLAGGRPLFVPLSPPTWAFDDKKLEQILRRKRTRFLLLNTPHNPTGRVFSLVELQRIAALCRKHDVIVISDETYEPFVYDAPHISIASLPDMRDRTLTITSVSKVLNVAGWRVGSILACEHLSKAVRLVNGLSLGAPIPLQEACARAMTRYHEFTGSLVDLHKPLRDQLCAALRKAGFNTYVPEGTLSIFAALASLPFRTDIEACGYLLENCGILAAPGSAFFADGEGTRYLRFSFARKPETITRACQALSALTASANNERSSFKEGSL